MLKSFITRTSALVIASAAFGLSWNIDRASAQNATYEGPVPKITTGYGALGPYQVSTKTLKNSRSYRKRNIKVYYPTGVSTPSPVLFYAHGFGGNAPFYNYELMEMLVSNGYVVVFVPYDSFVSGPFPHLHRYNQLWDGYQTAVNKEGSRMDLTRVGFFGHSYGGGAVPEMAHRGFVEEGWGSQGRMMFMMAPYYSYLISQSDLQAIPSDTKLLMQVYADDDLNDHRMAIDIFNTVQISNSNKDFSIISSDTVSGYTLSGDHALPTVQGTSTAVYDGYDQWGVFRHAHALANYALLGEAYGGYVSLGNGNSVQEYMGQTNGGEVVQPLNITDAPVAQQPESFYFSPCGDTTDNPRAQYCPN